MKFMIYYLANSIEYFIIFRSDFCICEMCSETVIKNSEENVSENYKFHTFDKSKW